MSTKRITTIVPIALLEPLETRLRACGVPGVTVEHVQGYGQHPNYFRQNLMKENARLVLYADSSDVDKLVSAIVSCAHESSAQAGLLAVESIDRLIDLGDGKDVDAAHS